MNGGSPASPVDLPGALRERVGRLLELGPGEDPSLVLVNSWEMDATRRTALCFRPREPRPS